MTRINLIDPTLLSGKHLVAEYRELPRIFSLAHASHARGEQPDDPRNPTAYRLGAGHVRFFYPRLTFLRRRFHLLVTEMMARGYAPTHTDVPPTYHNMPEAWKQDYTPNYYEIALSLARLRERDLEHYSDNNL